MYILFLINQNPNLNWGFFFFLRSSKCMLINTLWLITRGRYHAWVEISGAYNASANRRCHINNQKQQQSRCVSSCRRQRGWSMTAVGRQVYSSASCAAPQLISACVYSWWMTGAGRRQRRESGGGSDGREDRVAAPQWLNTSLQTWDAWPSTPQADLSTTWRPASYPAAGWRLFKVGLEASLRRSLSA